jgi:hypothetical protein
VVGKDQDAQVLWWESKGAEPSCDEGSHERVASGDFRWARRMADRSEP